MKTQYGENFQHRHIGPRETELQEMLKAIGSTSLDELIDQTVPAQIRLTEPLRLPGPMSEYEFLQHMRAVAAKNLVLKSYLGQGFYNTITPPVIQRNIFENPGWYTQYTPYQAEISQGRLEALLNFQTMICNLTGMDVANASLLDEGTAAAEAMTMVHGIVGKKSSSPRMKFFVSDNCFASTIDVIKTRALPLGFDVVVGDVQTFTSDDSYFGAIVQYPAQDGAVVDYRPFIENVHASGALVIVAADLLSLALLVPPGEFGADIAVGSSQRFGVPMGFGGPHAAYFSTKNEFIRNMPGRIIGVSIDVHNHRAYRMALQTREQHIRREKATSNICTAQALLAIMAGMYAVYHGPSGIRSIATRIHHWAAILHTAIVKIGFAQKNALFFDTLNIETASKAETDSIIQSAVQVGYNLRKIDDRHIGISLDETTQSVDVQTLISIFAKEKKSTSFTIDEQSTFSLPQSACRTSSYLQHKIFNSHHSETEMLRYIKSLENKDLSLTGSMIPLGSCTMKLNAASEMMPLSWMEFAHLHPYVPDSQVQGYLDMIKELEKALCEITGFAATSFQPNSGAQGEFTGLLVIRAYHADRGQKQRTVALIPSSAHGTNPASAVMAGFSVVVVQCDTNGNIDLADLRAKAETHKDNLATLMVTYPSTHGVFEEEIMEICNIVHANGGLVYMDGANMNAQVGLTSPAKIGADICHLNLHKTFGIPHGGGGPGIGPICAAKPLVPFLPGHPVISTGGPKAIHAVASAPYSSASILAISYGYVKMLGAEGLTEATKYAILNANYLKSKLEASYQILYTGKQSRVAHEFILNLKEFKGSAGVEAIDIAKRLMDYGFHAPTVAFPVHDTLMVEPTESEPKVELDRFIEAMVAIRQELQEIADKKADPKDNVLKNAPHPAIEVSSDSWNHSYPRSKAAFPVQGLREDKFWVPVGRINDTYGDKNIFCTCPPVESYGESNS